MIVVLDSGIWISAMQFHGAPFRAVVKTLAEDRIAVCARIEEEVVRVLTRKFQWEPERVLQDIAFYWRDALYIEVQGTVKGVCRDPNDEAILECAERARADYIVTGDQDLLSLKSYQGIHIITARQYLQKPH